MKLGVRPDRTIRRVRADQVLTTEQPSSSDIFDPRVDLPPGALERIKGWVSKHPGTTEEARFLVHAAWIGWIDPNYQQALQENTEVRDCEWNEFLDRRNGKRLRLASPPRDAAQLAQWKLTEKAASYIDFADLVEVFPEVRQKLQAPEFVDDFQQVLGYAVRREVDGHNISIVNRIQDLKTFIQVWPEHRAQITQALAEGGQDMQEWFVERMEEEESIVHAMAIAANLVMVFPALRPEVELVVKKRLSEIQTKLQKIYAKLHDDQGEGTFHAYQQFVKHLTILGAESAVLDAQGDLQVKLRPLSKFSTPQPLPTRPQV